MTSWARARLVNRPGVRAGIIVLAGSVVGHTGNYLFYVLAARGLGVEQFAEVTAMVAYSTIIAWPVNGLQVAVARDVARMRGAGDHAGLAGLVTVLVRRGFVLGLALAAALVAISPLLLHWLDLSTIWLPVVAGIWIVLLVWLIVGTGVAQGLERFGLFSALLAGPLGLLRAILLPLLVLVAGLTGSMLAMALATVVGLAMIAPALRSARHGPKRPVAFHPGSAMVALIAFASMTNVDVLVAKATLEADVAGAYSGAALLGKIALFAPSALALVLLPRAAAALERGERAERSVMLTMGVTIALGLLIAGILALLPGSVLSLTFGDDFAAGAALLAPLALVMTMAAVLNVHMTFSLARRSRKLPALMVAGAAGHLVLLAFWHDSPGEIVRSTAVAIGVVLAVHEATSRHGLIRIAISMLRTGAPKSTT
ncbi:MAG: hypothetical protein M3400_08465 [Actinomycetota bacterium]|nr:hypothetical protein [Actinomycetota bacterium]